MLSFRRVPVAEGDVKDEDRVCEARGTGVAVHKANGKAPNARGLANAVPVMSTCSCRLVVSRAPNNPSRHHRPF